MRLDQKQKGGVILGQGTYGCAITPPVKCGGLVYRKAEVSKIMARRDALEEMEEHKIVEIIDPENKFTLPMPKLCRQFRLDRQDDETFDDIRECNLRTPPSGMAAIIMKNGGISLGNISTEHIRRLVRNPKTKREIFLGLRRVFYGLNEIRKAGYYHNDIKPDNILLNDKNQFNIIDFGLMESIDTHRDTVQSYFVYPPPSMNLSTIFLWNIYEQLKKNNTRGVEKVIVNRYTSTSSYTNYIVNHSLWIDKDFFRQDHIDFYVNRAKRAKDKRDFADMIRRDHVSTLDVYSLGVTLMILFKKIVIGDEGRKSFDEKLDREFSDLWAGLARDMIKGDNRITQEEALRRYDRILESKGYRIREARTVPKQPTPVAVQDAVPSPQAPGRVSGAAAAGAGAGATDEGAPKPTRKCNNIKDAKSCNDTEGCFYVNTGKRRYCRKGTRRAKGQKARGQGAKGQKARGQGAKGQRAKGQKARNSKPTAAVAAAPRNPCKDKNEQECNALGSRCRYIKTAKRQYCRQGYGRAARGSKSGGKAAGGKTRKK